MKVIGSKRREEFNQVFQVPNLSQLSQCLHVQVSFQNTSKFNLRLSPKCELKNKTHIGVTQESLDAVKILFTSVIFGKDYEKLSVFVF